MEKTQRRSTAAALIWRGTSQRISSGSGLADKCGVASFLCIGKADPVAVDIDTFGTSALSNEALREIVMSVFNLRPAAIIEKLVLRNAIYADTATLRALQFLLVHMGGYQHEAIQRTKKGG